MKKIKLLFILFLFLAKTGFSQEATDSLKLHNIETNDGNSFIGIIMSESIDSLTLKTEKLGILHFAKTEIIANKELQSVARNKGRYWLPNPQSSRYFWAPNGYGLKKGEAYFQNIWVLYNQVSVGLTDYFSIGGGIVPLFLFPEGVTPVWLVPKLSIPIVKEKVNLGTGAFLGTVIGEDTGIFGLLYGTTTFGSRDKNMSIGLAYGFAGGEWMGKPVVNISAMVRTGPKGYFISENYFLPIDNQVVGIISLGGRTIIRNIGLDYSIWIPIGADIGSFIAVPFIGITIPL
jgi:hypothetical protein